MRRFALGIGLACAALAPVAPAAAAPIEVGHIPRCTELVPAAVAVPPGATTGLQVRVLLDGVSSARGQEVFATAAQSYAPLGITLQPTFEAVSFSGNDAQGLIDQAKQRFGGVRPPGSDLVYVLTGKNITGAGTDAVAGLADCIGGVAFGDRAFGVGENFAEDSFDLASIRIADSLSAKVAAHEIGHLLGGHHHYANCAEGVLSEFGQEASPCTLMFNAVDLSSLNFSSLNSLVVRGHAEAYAAP